MSDSATQYETLLIEQRGAVDWVTMNRPEALNSLNSVLVDELLDYFGKLYFNRATRIVVLRGGRVAGSREKVGATHADIVSMIVGGDVEAMR